MFYGSEERIMHRTKIDGTSHLRPGMDLVVTRWIAMEGTAALAREKEEELLQRFPGELIRTAQSFADCENMEERTLAEEFGECECLTLGEGGVLAALWQIADEAGTGLRVNLRKIPIRQETVEITEFFDVNPYGLCSRGALLVGTFKGQAFADTLNRRGIPAVVIGSVTEDRKRLIYNQEIERYVDKPARDEICKILPDYRSAGNEHFT